MDDRTATFLVWSLPTAISLHVFEEFAYPGGFVRWIRDFKTRKLRSWIYYFSINASAIAATILLAWLFDDHRIALYMYLYSAGLMAGNAASHLLASFQTRSYCPGSVTGGALLIPLFVISLWHFLRTGNANPSAAIVWACVGVVVALLLFGVDIRKTKSI